MAFRIWGLQFVGVFRSRNNMLARSAGSLWTWGPHTLQYLGPLVLFSLWAAVSLFQLNRGKKRYPQCSGDTGKPSSLLFSPPSRSRSPSLSLSLAVHSIYNRPTTSSHSSLQLRRIVHFSCRSCPTCWGVRESLKPSARSRFGALCFWV